MGNDDWSSTPPIILSALGTGRKARQLRWVEVEGVDRIVPALLDFVGGNVNTFSVLTGLSDPVVIVKWGPQFVYDEFKGGGTLKEARQRVLEGRDEGIECPCCDRIAQTHPYTLRSLINVLEWMVEIYKKDPNRWIKFQSSEAPESIRRGQKHAKLKHWGMVEEAPNVDAPPKRRSGEWRATKIGADFLIQRNIPARDGVLIYNNQVVRWSETYITYEEIEKSKRKSKSFLK